MPKLIFDDGKSQQIDFMKAKKIEKFLNGSPAQKLWIKSLKQIIYEDHIFCPHNWIEHNISSPVYKYDNSGKGEITRIDEFKGRKCSKCGRVDIFDVKT